MKTQECVYVEIRLDVEGRGICAETNVWSAGTLSEIWQMLDLGSCMMAERISEMGDGSACRIPTMASVLDAQQNSLCCFAWTISAAGASRYMAATDVQGQLEIAFLILYSSFLSPTGCCGQCIWSDRSPQKRSNRSGNFLSGKERFQKLHQTRILSWSYFCERHRIPSIAVTLCLPHSTIASRLLGLILRNYAHDHLASPSTITELPRCLVK